MKGITITQEIKNQFDERISFLNKRLNGLEDEYKKAKVNNNAYATGERLKDINPDWKMQKIMYRNELGLREEILKDAIIVD
jgi:hypothetical protein